MKLALYNKKLLQLVLKLELSLIFLNSRNER